MENKSASDQRDDIISDKPNLSETSLAEGIIATEKNPRYDAAVKRLLSEKVILAWIMKTCLEEYKDCSIEEIVSEYIESDLLSQTIPVMPDSSAPRITGINTENKTVSEGTVMFDLVFQAQLPNSENKIHLYINVEAQNDCNPGYPLIMRAIYYGCRLISSQYGTEFSDSHYENIKKVYSIWVCLNPPEKLKNSIAVYRISPEWLKEPETPRSAPEGKHHDLLSVVMIWLSDPKRISEKDIVKMLSVLFSEQLSAQDKQDILQNEYHIKMQKNSQEEVTKMSNLAQGLAQKWANIGFDKGFGSGFDSGFDSGFGTGFDKGEVQGKLASILSIMETMNLTSDQAMNAVKISEFEKPMYLALLKEAAECNPESRSGH